MSYRSSELSVHVGMHLYIVWSNVQLQQSSCKRNKKEVKSNGSNDIKINKENVLIDLSFKKRYSFK